MASVKDPRQLLQDAGLKVTPKRVLLLALLVRLKKPVSIEEVRQALTESAIDTVTLYRALEAFVATGLVRRVDLHHGHTDYELLESGNHHHHLVCTDCGDTEDVSWCPDRSAEKRLLKTSSKFAELRDHSLEFFGLCKACAL